MTAAMTTGTVSMATLQNSIYGNTSRQ